MKYEFSHLPLDCHNIKDIRAEIDHIDHLVISLLAKRFECIKVASQLKKSMSEVKAKSRLDSMLEQRKQWANDFGLNGDVIKGIYANLVNYFTEEEMKYFKQNK